MFSGLPPSPTLVNLDLFLCRGFGDLNRVRVGWGSRTQSEINETNNVITHIQRNLYSTCSRWAQVESLALGGLRNTRAQREGFPVEYRL